MKKERNKGGDTVVKKALPAKRSPRPAGKQPSQQKQQQFEKPTGPGRTTGPTSRDGGGKEDEKNAGGAAAQDLRSQQLLLDVFRAAVSPDADVFPALLQEVKQALYDRDFARAFGRPEYLEAYAARWSPTRALCYAALLLGRRDHLRPLYGEWRPPAVGKREHDEPGADDRPAPTEDEDEAGKSDGPEKDIGLPAVAAPPSSSPPPPPPPARVLKILCIGGGAAEVAAVGGFLNQIAVADDAGPQEQGQGPSEEKLVDATLAADLHLVDSAPWGPVVSKLATGLTTPPALSPYANAASRAAANTAFTCPDQLTATFHQLDALELDEDELRSLCRTPSGVGSRIELGNNGATAAAAEQPGPEPGTESGPGPILITLLFTLNELFTAGGTGRTTAFLLRLTAAAPPRSLLLVVDSPGSYSETAVGSRAAAAANRYPMHWLLDRFLLAGGGGGGGDGGGEEVKGEAEEEGKGGGIGGGGGRGGRRGGGSWTKLDSRESAWFRMPESLRYPIPLENMRYQMHLYRRL